MQAPLPAASLLTATFNWPAAPAKLFRSLCARSRHDFEAIVADDGSTPGPRARLTAGRALAPVAGRG